MNKKLIKMSALSLTAALTLSTFTPLVGAQSPFNHEQVERISISSVEQAVTKEQLISRLKEVFPGTFNFLNNNDFQMVSGHRYPHDEEGTVRYSLSFHKSINGKFTYGDIGFIGEDLHIEHFHYQPINLEDAFFPGKVSEDEAQKIAETFLKKVDSKTNYQFGGSFDYSYGNQTLTEPIYYNFTFNREKDGIPIADQSVQINVLASGDISSYYHMQMDVKKETFDVNEGIIGKEDALEQLNSHLDVSLRYFIDYTTDYENPKIRLAYVPNHSIQGIHAKTGKWSTAAGFVDEYPSLSIADPIVDKPLQPRQEGMKLEDVKRFAEKLLAIDSDEITLRIEQIDEQTRYDGREVYSVYYSYEYRHGGYGTSLEIDKQTGDIVSYHDVKSDVLYMLGKNSNRKEKLSFDEALKVAVTHLKEYAPSHLHHYTLPPYEQNIGEEDRYYFSFPRVKDGLLVEGDSIYVSVDAKSGDLLSLSSDYREWTSWPSLDQVITEEEAKAIYTESLDVKLSYVPNYNGKAVHYDLVYVPTLSDDTFIYLDAVTGKWTRGQELKEELPTITHPWAEQELNYLIQAGILTIDDFETFDPNETITKGKALEVTLKSLMRFYGYPYYDENGQSATFENIDKDHPLYEIIENAVQLNIIDKNKSTFPVDESVTREELASWYIRLLGLDAAGKQHSIYNVSFKDASNISKEYVGYVALADSLGLLTATNGQFKPKHETTYAEVAVSSFRLAKEMQNRQNHWYY